jgi:hypothetical protein
VQDYGKSAGGERGASTADKCILSFESLSTMNLSQHLYDTSNTEGNTFLWIHNHPSFTALINKASSGVWHITGKPGCGKTVLSKFIYKTLRPSPQEADWKGLNSRTTRAGSKTPVVVFYAFSERVEGRRRAVNAVASLFAQLFRRGNNRSRKIPREVTNEFDRRQKSVENEVSTSPMWSLQELLVMFYSTLTCSYSGFEWEEDVVCIIDALDECILKVERRELLDCIERITKHHGEHTVKFIKLDMNVEDAMDKDLAAYAAAQVATLIKARPHFRAYQGKILSRIQERADKMYLLVKLLVDMILNITDSSRRALEELLNSLPSTLAEIYNKIWTHLGVDRERAKAFFTWVLCAFRPLTLEEFATFVAI